jgi:hypothetical protein
VAFAEADRLGGTVYDLRVEPDGALALMVAVPEGAGVDAAFASLVLRDLYRRVEGGSPEARLEALMAAYQQSPLGRPVELLLARMGPDGSVHGVAAGLSPPSLVGDDGERVEAVTLGPPLAGDGRLAPPARPFDARLDGRALVLFDDGLPAAAARRLTRAEVLARAVELARRDPQSVADDLVALAVGRYHKQHSDDFFALVVRR